MAEGFSESKKLAVIVVPNSSHIIKFLLKITK